MEEEKAAAYYDELTRKGGGAARFKQGLGFSASADSSSDSVRSRGSALASSSTFLSNFVKASNSSDVDKQAQLQSIQDKLKAKPRKNRSRSPSLDKNRELSSRDRSPGRDRKRSRRSRSRDRHSRDRSRSRSRSRDRHSRRRSPSGDRHSRRRSRSQSSDRHSRWRRRSRDKHSSRRSRSRDDRKSSHKYRPRSRSREKSRSELPRGQRLDRGKKSGDVGSGREGVDYEKLIEGYNSMTPAERVKAKMKFQLSETAQKDEGMGSGVRWERFDFNKDAPVDDEEIEAAEDDAALVRHIGQSFRFSAVEARKEEELKAAHDEAMFGSSSVAPRAETETDYEVEDNEKKEKNESPFANLLSEQVIAMQQGSWRDRAFKT